MSFVYYLSKYYGLDAYALVKAIEKLNEDRLWPNPIVTEITQLGIFYRAEDYHQNYYQLNPNNPYCQFVISPKLVKFKQQIRYK